MLNNEVCSCNMEFILDTDHNAFESADVSNKFKDQNWSFMECLKEDIKDILSLYEAPFLALEGENLLEEAKALTRWNVEDLNSRNLVKQANHALQLPLHRSTDKLTAEWSIEAHRKRGDANQIFLEFSILDCKMVQSVFQRDLRDISWSSDKKVTR